MQIRIFIYVIIFLINVCTVIAGPKWSLKISGEMPLFDTEEYLGKVCNLYRPKWSQNGNYVGVDCYTREKISVLVYSLPKKVIGEYSRGAKPGISKSRGHATGSSISSNTMDLSWSPEKNHENEFFVTSSLRRNYDLYRVKLSLIGNKYGFQEGKEPIKIPGPKNLHISDLNFKRNNQNRLLGIFSASLGTISDLYTYEREAKKVKIEKIKITINHRKYEPDIFLFSDTRISCVYAGISAAAQDIYYLDNIHQSNNLKNLTNTPNAVERMPIFSPDGRYIAYISTYGHVDFATLADTAGQAVDLEYGLRIYDTQTSQDREIFFPVYVDSKQARQNPYAWLPDNEHLIVINNDIPKKEPLVVINIHTFNSVNLESPLYHHHDIELSPDGKKLAVIARGHKNSNDFTTLKLFIADLKK